MLFLYFRYIYGWYEFRFYKETPKEYISNNLPNKGKYSSDSTDIVFQIRGFIKNHKESFYSKDNDESTQIIVDTILYNPDYNKIATFIITKNSTSKQLIKDKNHKWYYDATCYLGAKHNDSLSLTQIGTHYGNSDMKSISQIIRNYYFRERSSDPNHSNNTYNFNDIRYWSNSKDWKKIENYKEMQKNFEEEKIKHPENVYDPNNQK